MADRLYRSRNDRMLAGVAAGVADSLDADPSLVRVVWALLVVFTGGVALLVYVVMAVVVPEAPAGWEAGAPGASATGPSVGGTAPLADTTATSATDREARRAARRARREAGGDGRGAFLGGVVLIVIGAFFLLRQVVPRIDWDLWWPVASIAVGVLLLVFAVFPSRRSE